MEVNNYWSIFKNNFLKIIESGDFEYYNNMLKTISNYDINILLYSTFGFPLELFIDEIIKKKFDIKVIYRNEHIWEKNIIYNENQYFLEIDLMNPNMNKDFNNINKFILYIIKSKNIVNNNKHFIIIKNIDFLDNYFYAFRILLERYSSNVYFLCSTYKISKIESPIKSRFILFRFPLFTQQEIKKICSNLNIPLNHYLIDNKTRNIINAIFIAEVERNEPHLINYQFCNYNFPPLFDFINENDYTIENIRNLSYKCCQYNINISQITLDLLKMKSKKNKLELISNAANIDHILTKTNKGREPIHIEALLADFFI
jgi:hypothetical protein